MRVVVSGDYRNPVLLDTKQATGLLICNEDGSPNCLFRFFPDGSGWVRLTKGEDANFDEIAQQMKLVD